MGGFLVKVSYFLMVNSKCSWMSENEYDPFGKSKVQFQVGAEIFYLLLLYPDLMFCQVFHCFHVLNNVNLTFVNALYNFFLICIENTIGV